MSARAKLHAVLRAANIAAYWAYQQIVGSGRSNVVLQPDRCGAYWNAAQMLRTPRRDVMRIVRRRNSAYVLNMRDVNHDGLRDLTFSVEKLDPNLGLAAPSTTLMVRGAVPTGSGPIVLRGSVVMAVSP